MSEESGPYRMDRAVVVVVDPVDGSTNAARGIPWYATSLCATDAKGPRAAVVVNQASGVRFEALRHGGARRDGEPITPSTCETLGDAIIGFSGYPPRYLGWSQYRGLGAAALDLCAVAEGALDAYAVVGGSQLGSWDYLGGLLICTEAGAVGRRIVRTGPLHAAARRSADPSGRLHPRPSRGVTGGGHHLASSFPGARTVGDGADTRAFRVCVWDLAPVSVVKGRPCVLRVHPPCAFHKLQGFGNFLAIPAAGGTRVASPWSRTISRCAVMCCVFSTSTVMVALLPRPAYAATATGWNIVTSPSADTTSNELLLGTTCANALECWGVGATVPNGGTDDPLFEQWDGTNWTLSPSPAPPGADGYGLFGVTCVSGSDCWAVGAVIGPGGLTRP